MKKIKTDSIVNSSIYLSIANIISTVAVMIQGMILVRALTKLDYGTYAQANVILNITNVIVGMGLAASLNYFIPKTHSLEQRTRYINNIFSLVLISGVLGFLGIFLLGDFITIFFDNNSLKPLILIISLRPLFFGLLQAFINLFVANKLSNIVAIRNIIMSTLSLIILGIVSSLTHDIKEILLCLLILDALQCAVFYFYSKKQWGKILFCKLEIPIMKEIFVYSIPLALSAIVGTLMIQMDRLIIGKLFSTEEFAEYALMSTVLPFTIIAGAIVTVVRPYITTSFNSNDKKKVITLWSQSIELSSIITWTIGFALMLVSSELITILYTKQYLGGLIVFNIYIVYSMIGITYFGMLLSASGKSKYIFYYAVIALVINGVFSVIFYWFFGYIGPALASVLSIIVINSLQLKHSSHVLGCKVREIINFKVLSINVAIMLITFLIMLLVKKKVEQLFNIHEVINLLMFGGLYCLILGSLYYKKMKIISGKLRG